MNVMMNNWTPPPPLLHLKLHHLPFVTCTCMQFTMHVKLQELICRAELEWIKTFLLENSNFLKLHCKFTAKYASEPYPPPPPCKLTLTNEKFSGSPHEVIPHIVNMLFQIFGFLLLFFPAWVKLFFSLISGCIYFNWNIFEL